MDDLKKRLRRLPKGDLHNHLTLGPSLRSLTKRYANCGLSVPASYDGLEGMEEHIHNAVNKVMATGADVVAFMEIAIEDSIEDGVVLLEASVDTNLSRYFDGSIDRVIEEVAKLKKKYASRIDFRPDIGVNKRRPADKAYESGTKCIESGVFSGIDLYGLENGARLDAFVSLYGMARARGLRTKVHIGEFSDWRTIEETVALLDPDEIQHGIRAVDSRATMDLLVGREIHLNVCPRSNVCLGSVKSLREHPIRRLFDHGVSITINTDDRLLFGSSVTDQYMSLIEEGVFTFDEVDSMRENSLRVKPDRRKRA